MHPTELETVNNCFVKLSLMWSLISCVIIINISISLSGCKPPTVADPYKYIPKIFASVCNLLVLTVFSGLCNYFASVRPLGGLENRGAAITTTMGMFLTTIVLFALAFLVSSLSKTYKRTALFGTGLLLGCYGVYIVAELLEFRLLYYFTPLKYFDVYTVAREGISLIFLLLAAVITTLSVAIAKKMWIDREIGI